MWLWEDLTVKGDENWLEQSIPAGSVIAVMDGLYQKDLYPNISSSGFVLECKQGRGRIHGSLVEQSSEACAYRGEPMGLTALLLILCAVNTVKPNLPGRVQMCSDCLGALSRVAELPDMRIPSSCSHSDLLKTIMVYFWPFSFGIDYAHVRAHQDDHL